jgi:hypothetical protein
VEKQAREKKTPRRKNNVNKTKTKFEKQERNQ